MKVAMLVITCSMEWHSNRSERTKIGEIRVKRTGGAGKRSVIATRKPWALSVWRLTRDRLHQFPPGNFYFGG